MGLTMSKTVQQMIYFGLIAALYLVPLTAELAFWLTWVVTTVAALVLIILMWSLYEMENGTYMPKAKDIGPKLPISTVLISVAFVAFVYTQGYHLTACLLGVVLGFNYFFYVEVRKKMIFLCGGDS